LKIAKLLKSQDCYTLGKKVIKAMINFKELSHVEFEKCFEKFDDANNILKTNIFAYHPESNTITFQSCAIEYYIQENKHVFIDE
jgi:hypothetical protein